MKILLANTGRGGELAVFTSLVKAYREHVPNAHITLLTCDNGIYSPLFRNSPDHDGWVALQFRDENAPNYKNPIGAMNAYFVKTKKDFDIQEFACEFDFSPGFKRTNTGTILSNCYKRIKKKFFKLSEVRREIFIYPTDEELRFAEDTFTKYGNDLVMVSYCARSASAIMNHRGYQDLCDQIGKHRPVAFTANAVWPNLNGHIDLRGITFSALFAISQRLERFVGPDTATTWIVANMPGMIISLRGDNTYPISNTGLVAGGYRETENTYEIDFAGRRHTAIIDQILQLVR